MDNLLEKCFICAEETSQHSRNLMQLVTKYSGTLVYKMIERFLESDLSDNIASLIVSVLCQECVVRLNDYDAAQTKAIIIQKELTELLRKNMIIVDQKVTLGQEMYFKEEVDDDAYLEHLSELVEEQNDEEDLEDVKTVYSGTDKSVSMKCNSCGELFTSMHEMQTHSHRNSGLLESEIEMELEILDEGEETEGSELDQVEYIDEERLEDEKFSVVDSVIEELNFEQLIEDEESSLPVRTVLYRPVRCVHCNVECSTKARLKNHIKEQHPTKLRRDAHVCNICGLVVRTKAALTAHVAKHSRTANFDCTFCGKQFPQKSALTRHVPIHTGEKPYQCDQCGKQFVHYSSFHMHQLAHGNIREKKCDICGYMLRSSSHLARHMRVHSGEKPFECPTCGQKFAQRYNMMTHLKAHQGIYREYSKIYKCHFCDGIFQRKLKLQEHLTRVHNTVIDSGLLKPIERPKKTPSKQIKVVHLEEEFDENLVC